MKRVLRVVRRALGVLLVVLVLTAAVGAAGALIGSWNRSDDVVQRSGDEVIGLSELPLGPALATPSAHAGEVYRVYAVVRKVNPYNPASGEDSFLADVTSDVRTGGASAVGLGMLTGRTELLGGVEVGDRVLATVVVRRAYLIHVDGVGNTVVPLLAVERIEQVAGD